MNRKIKIELPGVVTPSLNKLLRMHFRNRMRLKRDYEWLLIAAEANEEKYKAGWGERRRVSVTSYRKSLLDFDNLVGSFKILIDALQSQELIFLDEPKFLDLTVSQELDPKNTRTEIVIEWQDDSQSDPKANPNAAPTDE